MPQRSASRVSILIDEESIGGAGKSGARHFLVNDAHGAMHDIFADDIVRTAPSAVPHEHS